MQLWSSEQRSRRQVSIHLRGARHQLKKFRIQKCVCSVDSMRLAEAESMSMKDKTEVYPPVLRDEEEDGGHTGEAGVDLGGPSVLDDWREEAEGKKQLGL